VTEWNVICIILNYWLWFDAVLLNANKSDFFCTILIPILNTEAVCFFVNLDTCSSETDFNLTSFVRLI
jgi:hypothetical protein